MRKGVALVLSGPSGAGKSTLSWRLLQEFPQISFSISCTSRPIRQGEENGKDYYFITREEFERKKESGEFAEWAIVHGNLYGTPIRPIQDSLAAGKDILLDVDFQGALQLKLIFPLAKFLFILPPTLAILEERLRHRALDSENVIKERLKKAKKEMAQISWYDAVIINDDLGKAYDQLRAVYISATLDPAVNAAQLKAFWPQEGC